MSTNYATCLNLPSIFVSSLSFTNQRLSSGKNGNSRVYNNQTANSHSNRQQTDRDSNHGFRAQTIRCHLAKLGRQMNTVHRTCRILIDILLDQELAIPRQFDELVVLEKSDFGAPKLACSFHDIVDPDREQPTALGAQTTCFLTS